MVAIVSIVATAGSMSVGATKGDPHKVGICHRTASDTNPYVYIEVDVAALKAHIGADAHPPKSGRYDYLAPNGKTDCKGATPSPTPTPMPTPTATPTATPSLTPTLPPTDTE